jgi:hypothetical protein
MTPWPMNFTKRIQFDPEQIELVLQMTSDTEDTEDSITPRDTEGRDRC